MNKIRLLGRHKTLIFTIEKSEELRKLHDLGSLIVPLTLEAKYGLEVEFARDGFELRITVTPA